MVVSNRDRIGKMLEQLREGLGAYVEREMRARLGKDYHTRLVHVGAEPDIAAYLKAILDCWQEVFSAKLSPFDRSLVHELLNARNRWAHQDAFVLDDTERALDNASRLLRSVSAPQAEAVDQERQELLRVRFDDLAKREERRATASVTSETPGGGLKPWREVVTPHPDVATGRYQQAEFAADLGQVARGEGGDEYKNPRDFFARTFLTAGLRDLLTNALERLAGTGGEPVVKLQTNFGGGKTHAMIALFHLCSGASASEYPGLESVLAAANVSRPPKATRAVLVGTALSPGQPHTKPDGTVIHTLWGEMAHQLLGADGYAMVADADRNGTSPGSDVLRDLLTLASPCCVLIDEWVAFARQLWGMQGLPGGSYEANMTFAQALSEAVKAVPDALLIASIPASDIEVGGTAGRQALASLENTIGRIESIWRPASTEEGFEIVRRRLFEPITDAANFTARDAVAKAFTTYYRANAKEFPTGCGESDYERRIIAAYPIHPELFDRLYEDWSALERFQRTRGVLRLMAKVIHTLWESGDKSLLILPSTIPMDDREVQSELTRYLEENWLPVVETDVDGRDALPRRIDEENPTLGRYAACRRVARTVFFGSAPKLKSPTKGVEEQSIKIGSAQPGESVATFGDALRRLTNQATFLYVNGNRYWYATQPSVGRLAQDRAVQQDDDVVLEEIRKQVREESRQRGDFTGVHPCPVSTANVPDEAEVRLVILDPEYPHTANDTGSPAFKAATLLLDERGNSPRRFRNMLVFLAADRARLDDLTEAVRSHLAWQSIHDERETLNLDTFQARQAESKVKQFAETVKQRIAETFQWLLVPTQPDPRGAMTWEKPIRVQGPDALAVRASKRLKNEELLIADWAPTLLRRELDRIPLWKEKEDHVNLKALWEDFAQYVYLPRLRDGNVLASVVRDGVSRLTWASETFAYADGYDAAKQRYIGLRTGASGSVLLDGTSVLVKPDAAQRQIEPPPPPPPPPPPDPDGNGKVTPPIIDPPPPPPPPQVRRVYGSVPLNAHLAGLDASKVVDEVIRHLNALVGAEVTVTLEISAEVPGGIPDDIVRTVSENARTLKFTTSGFEEG